MLGRVRPFDAEKCVFKCQDLFVEFYNSVYVFADLIEFQQSSDRKTGKPIAVSLMKLPSATVLYEMISDKPVPGLVLSEAKPSQNRGVCSHLQEISISLNCSNNLHSYNELN